MRGLQKAVVALAVALLTGVGLVAGAAPAVAADGDIGSQDQAFNGSVNAPTSDKPQSKLWYVDGLWWADMFDTVSRTWHIFRLDRASQKWIDTGVVIDDRPNTLADAMWDGSHLYVASHVVTISSDSTPKASVPNSPARLLRYSYSSAGKTFSLDAGFPVTITDFSSESMTIDKDSAGKVWATWTQVSGNATTGFTSAVYVNATTGNDNSWGMPFVMPTAGSNPAPDDISAVVAFGKNKIGILWSNQVDDVVYWAVHLDGAAVGDWRGSPAIRGNRQADDHLNLKAIQADQAGRVFAAVKTSADDVAGAPKTDAQILLLVFKPGTGAWSATTFGTLADCHTRPQLVLDEEHSIVHVLATAPTSAGCPFSGAAGSIYDKSAPMDNPVFSAGRGTPIIREAASENMNDAATTKQSVNGGTGLVVLASNTVTKRYWHSDISLGGTTPPPPAPAPTAGFTASPTSGAAPLGVQFTDTSTGSPTSWAWDFGDGGTATTQNPAHTYAAAGSYTVTLRSTNAAGTSAPATKTISVTAPPPPSGGGVTAGTTTTATSTAAVTGVTLNVPTGVSDGDVLIAQFTADNAPAVSAAPAGWATVVSPYLGMGGGARVFVYYHVVGSAAAEPASYTWQLSSAQKWNGGVADFHGVDRSTPFDTAATTASDSTFGASKLTVPGVTTVTPGALVVGGVGMDSSATAVTQPTSWTEAFESSGAQVSEVADQGRPTAGDTGTQTWTFAKAVASAGWMRALRPE
jgi:hypothetical protein